MQLRRLLVYGVWFFVAALACAHAQQSFSDRIALSTDASAARRFVAVHGQRAVLMGYSQQGLEAWAYPFQILSGYQVGFLPEGSTSESDGRLLLRRIIYQPDSITRVYLGPDYMVREKLFVPVSEPAAVVSYEVTSPHPVDIVIHFTPVLNLMWPAALGGQSTAWNQAASGYVMREPAHGISAVVASPQIIAHDPIANTTLRNDGKLAFTLHPVTKATQTATASVYVSLQPVNTKDSASTIQSLSSRLPELETQAREHYAQLEQNSIRIHTPDEDANAALAWAPVALDQAWVCNPQIGCGIVAGYGPSRSERRPQYDWFFAGDGLVTTSGLLAAGQYSRAREELEFIAKYQDQKTGMVWHEMSQSAGYIDWSKYPYMFVHVDISFDYLSVVSRYVSITGDTAFAADHWSSIAAAYRYCQSIIRSSDHLPHIPADKEGGNEQERPDDDLGLSSAWVAATASFAELAKAAGHPQIADEAQQANQLARDAIAAHYWDSAHQYWIDGHTESGAPIFTRRSGASRVILQDIFSAQQNEELLNQLASSQLQTDWGMRGVAADSPIFDPYSYATGSIFALHSTSTALTFWQAHRPVAAFALWDATLPWNTLDSLGHIHEVLAGNFYREQLESVPEQTWSSAGLLDATVHGLLGIEVQGTQNRVVFAPHLPAEWKQVSIENVRLPRASLDFTVSHTPQSIDLEIHNQGNPVKLLFQPQLPLGATIVSAEVDGHTVKANIDLAPEEEQARLEWDVPTGISHCHLQFTGGVSLILDRNKLQVGDTSTEMKVTSVKLANQNLSIDADISAAGTTTFRLQTPWKIVTVKGATVSPFSDGIYELTMQQPSAPENLQGYKHTRVEITFANR